MTEPTPQQKGDALEKAVRAIETAILRCSPSYSEDTFNIEGKKVLRVAGVRHEIDIFVTVVHGLGYDAIFIFECKNWEKKVGKRDIVDFAEKIRACKAQRGFFVAKSFSADAVAQAELEPRMELLTAVELDPSAVIIPGSYHAIQVGSINARLEIHVKADEPENRPADIATASFVLEGATSDMKAYVDAWANEARERRTTRFGSVGAEEGLHLLDFNEERMFTEGQAYVEGRAVRSMLLTGTVEVHVHKAVVISAFDVATRGRFIDTRVDLPGISLNTGFVTG